VHLVRFNRLVLAKSVAETLVRLAGEILGNGIITSTLGVLADGEPLVAVGNGRLQNYSIARLLCA